ncbi:MAG TPA: dihydrofolate reductase family protein [Chitinophagaceae bacterium]|jgi:dihydrofolate reductase
MGKLVYAINLTLDGCCDHSKLSSNADIHDYHAQLLRETDTLLYGRKTYELMVPFWPDLAKSQSAPTKSFNDFALAFDSVNNIVVFSKSLVVPEGGKTRVVRSDLKQEIMRMKNEEGRNILIGGVDVPSQLVQLDLIDEFHFVIQPIVVGEGRRLFDHLQLPRKAEFRLTASKVFESGCVALHYATSSVSAVH